VARRRGTCVEGREAWPAAPGVGIMAARRGGILCGHNLGAA
jgi:hypothetical protein